MPPYLSYISTFCITDNNANVKAFLLVHVIFREIFEKLSSLGVKTFPVSIVLEINYHFKRQQDIVYKLVT